MTQLNKNNAYSALNDAITIGALSLTLATGTGSRFDSPTGGDYFLLTLADVSGGSEAAWEIVKVTARSGDTLTIERAQEGTTARTWASGTPVDVRVTAGTLAKYVDLTSTQTLTNKTLTGVTETVYVLSGATPAFLEANGSVQTWTLSANSTPTDSLTAGQSIMLSITPGAYSITWPAGIVWTKQGGSGTTPQLFTAGKTHVLLWKIASTLYGTHAGDTV